jgi:DNA polymerase-4
MVPSGRRHPHDRSPDRDTDERIAMSAPTGVRMSALCRECLTTSEAAPADARCAACGSPRLMIHDELDRISIAHIDCDAFYAAVEKRDDPSLRDKPVIVGGGHRGVVSTCCYVARLYGVRSAMPMFKALKACPDAIVIRPNMAKYASVGREVKRLMLETTPLVESLSVDEAFLDLSGTEKLHHGAPARTLAALARRIEAQIGITVSIGLSYNKFLAKIASDLDKPRGYAIIGRGDALSFLAERPVSLIWGVGPALQRRLARDGIARIGQLQTISEAELSKRYGAIGRRLARFSRGLDDRTVEPESETKSVSCETTFDIDIADGERLLEYLWPLCEELSGRMKRSGFVGRTMTLKLKTADFRILTRSRTTAPPSNMAEEIYAVARPALLDEATGTAYRLIGVGMSGLTEIAPGSENLPDDGDLFDAGRVKARKIEQAIDALRDKHGAKAIRKGRSSKR